MPGDADYYMEQDVNNNKSDKQLNRSLLDGSDSETDNVEDGVSSNLIC